MEVEDDAFFADLSRRISLLIMDDDDDETPVSSCPSVSLQAFSRAIHPMTQTPFSYEQTSCKRDQSKGTGVFIPQSSQWRRKNNRQARFNSFNNNTKSHHHKQPQQQQQHENTRSGISHVPYNFIVTNQTDPRKMTTPKSQ